jgi:hypothetical protein
LNLEEFNPGVIGWSYNTTLTILNNTSAIFPPQIIKFVNWTCDGIINSESATTTVTVNGDYSIKADFERTTILLIIIINLNIDEGM